MGEEFKEHLRIVMSHKDAEADKLFQEVADELGCTVLEIKVEYLASSLALILS